MRKALKAIALAGAVCAAMVLPGGGASAATDRDVCWMDVAVPEWGAGTLYLKSCNAFRVYHWNADGSRPEIFAVRVDRTIWHAWPGSNGWVLMPGNKTADDMINLDLDPPRADGKDATWWSGSTRNLSVWASGGTGFWCTSDPGTGWTGRWRDCG